MAADFAALKQPISEQNYVFFREMLAAGAWRGALANLDVRDPVIAVTHPPGAVNGINYLHTTSGLSASLSSPPPWVAVNPAVAVPVLFSAGLTKGDLLLGSCWAAGLSPRPDAPAGGPAVLRFVPSPLTDYATRPPTIAVLEAAATPRPRPAEPAQGFPFLEIQVRDLLVRLADANGFGVVVQAHPALLMQWAFVPFAPTLSLTELLDQLAGSIDAVWDWAGPRVLLAPRPGARAAAYFHAGACADLGRSPAGSLSP